MKIFTSFQQELRNQNHEEAKLLALEIESSNYPESLKLIAREYLESTGEESISLPNEYEQALYHALAYQSQEMISDTSKSWLPWRIICEVHGITIDSHSPEKANTIYQQDYLQTGRHTLHYLSRLEHGQIANLIGRYFDDEHYRASHEDMRGKTREEVLLHYLTFGFRERTRMPNPLFSNQNFYSLYPWTYALETNPLYLITRWPEQFPELAGRIRRQYEIAKSQAKLPWDRAIAIMTPADQHTSNSDYLRILSMTKEVSGGDRRISPDGNKLNIHFVIPDFTAGGGGHMTIFRLVLHLEKAGHSCTVWIKDYLHSRHPQGPRVSAVQHYQPIKAQVLPLSAHFAFSHGDALIATSWDTVELVESHKSFTDKFYLVQDYEPYFFARGAESLQAEYTYRRELKTICASTWLDEIMRTNFNRKSTYFSLSYNPSVYYPKRRRIHLHSIHTAGPSASETQDSDKPVIRVAFYARSRTERRAVQLALKGLELVNQDRYSLCIELFGEEKGKVLLPQCVIGFDNGILTPSQLAELYRNCDIGLTFSATNYALVPQEMMACGLPVIEIDNDSTRAIYPEGVVRLAHASPSGVAEAIEEMAMDEDRRRAIAEAGRAWVQNTSWDESFGRVEEFIRDEISNSALQQSLPEDIASRYLAQPFKTICAAADAPYKVTVVVPTFNGGVLLQEVIANTLSQELPEEFELLILDSESTDGSIMLLPQENNVSIYEIYKKDFQHGRARNLAIALAKAPLVAFLTQDAVPADKQWLKNLIQPLLQSDEVAGVFGRHSAHKDHPGYLKLWMNSHFSAFTGQETYRKTDSLQRYYSTAPSHRQFLHFYSDNNSCLRKSTWQQYPYPDVSYGEDQLWADWIIQNDYKKAYADRAVVYHSHHYSYEQEFDRSATESLFFMKYFGYELAQDRLELEIGLEHEAKKLLTSSEIEIQGSSEHLLMLLRAKREGYRAGCRQYKEWLRHQAQHKPT